MGDFSAPLTTIPDIARLYEALARRFPADAAALREIGRDACDFSRAIEAFGAMPDPLLMSMGKAMASYPAGSLDTAGASSSSPASLNT